MDSSLTKLSISYETIKDMLSYRGFIIKKLPIEYKSSVRVSNKKEIVEIRYLVSDSRINTKKITTTIDSIWNNLKKSDKSKEVTIILVINETKLTPSVEAIVQNLNNKYNIYIQVFSIKNLLFDITKHKMCPKHIRIQKSEYQHFIIDFLDSHHIASLDCLPKIKEYAPVAKYLGLRKGDLCKIIRPSKSAGLITVYRYCT